VDGRGCVAVFAKEYACMLQEMVGIELTVESTTCASAISTIRVWQHPLIGNMC